MEINQENIDFDLGACTPLPSARSAEPDLFSDLAPGDEVPLSLVPYEDEEPPAQPMTPWPTRLPFELALAVEPEEDILLRHGVSPDRYAALKYMPSFRRALAEAQKQVREEGLVFPIICRQMAREFLEEIYVCFFDKRTTLTQKHDLLKTVTKLGGLEPQPSKEGVGGAVAVQININL